MADLKKGGSREILKDIFETARDQSPEVRQQILGRELVNRLFMLYRTGRLHTLENVSIQQAVRAFQSAIASLGEFGESASLTALVDSFYVNRTLLKIDFSSFENFRYLLQLFTQIKVGGLQINGVPDEAEIKLLLQNLLRAERDPAFSILDAAFTHIRFFRPEELKETDQEHGSAVALSDPEYLLRLYFKAVLFLNEYIEALRSGEFISIQRIQRVTHELIDAMGNDPAAYVALSSLRSPEMSLAFQAVNVSLLSLWMGRHLLMTSRQLSDLGVAALLHDIGRIRLAPELLGKSGPLSEEERKEISGTPTVSLMQMIRTRGFNESTLKRMIVAYEHTMETSEEAARRPTLFSRIVSVCHCYVAMTTSQPYRDALLPDEALRLIGKESGTKFDPLLVRLLVRLVSPFPPGSLVALTTGEVGVVTGVGHVVRILYDRQGQLLSAPSEGPLAADVRIRCALDAGRFGIQPLAYFFEAGL